MAAAFHFVHANFNPPPVCLRVIIFCVRCIQLHICILLLANKYYIFQFKTKIIKSEKRSAKRHSRERLENIETAITLRTIRLTPIRINERFVAAFEE